MVSSLGCSLKKGIRHMVCVTHYNWKPEVLHQTNMATTHFMTINH